VTLSVAEAPIALAPQPFEAEFVGGPVLRLSLGAPDAVPALRARLPALLDEARAEQVRLISCRLPVEWHEAGGVLTGAGFREIEHLHTFERSLSSSLPPGPDGRIAPTAPADHAACIEIGRNAFETDRFHADPLIPRAAADALKARWVRNDLNGRADAALVARDDGLVAGFNLLLRQHDTAVIDLIAVAAGHRGRGLGGALIAAALHHYAGRAARMRVGTQAANEASIALYRRFDFRPVKQEVTFHWHSA
jgi:GNAT superfamily N-acetyltransferase